MLTSLHIKNFRGFRDLKIESLKRVNLITGQNNTGKTGVLEALALLVAEPSPDQNLSARLPNLFRTVGGDWNENFWKWLVNNKSSEKNIEIMASFDDQRDWLAILGSNNITSTVLASYFPDNFELPDLASYSPNSFESPDLLRHSAKIGIFDFHMYSAGRGRFVSPKPAIFSTHPSDPIQNAIDYNRVVSKRRKKQVEGMLRQIEPRLESIEALQISQGPQGAPLMYAEISDLTEMIPVTQLGQGFSRILDIYSEIVVGDAKVLLIDEIENGLHHSVLPLIWKGLFLAAKEFDVQIFATTHSWECILAADRAAREQETYDLELIRLDPVKENIKATIIDQDALATAKEFKWEIR